MCTQSPVIEINVLKFATNLKSSFHWVSNQLILILCSQRYKTKCAGHVLDFYEYAGINLRTTCTANLCICCSQFLMSVNFYF